MAVLVPDCSGAVLALSFVLATSPVCSGTDSVLLLIPLSPQLAMKVSGSVSDFVE